ncbi:MAG: hypothetical protein DWQ04_14210 [Chloroflexi bacterium]|nr:MAG: hypothetical protein DWQ04_14210 [Chloroflexota bacterium]
MFAAVVLILFLVAAVHELGHLLVGRFARLQFYLLVIGPLRFSRENGRFQVNIQRGLGFFNGMAASIPKDTINLRRRMLLFALGGPCASLLLTGTSLLIANIFWENGRFSSTNAWIWEIALFTAITSFLFFLTSMKPGAYQNGFMADGGRIASLLKADANADSWCALVAINAAELQGVRPCAWDAAQVTLAVQLQGHSYDSLMAQLVGYQWEMDHGHFDAADVYLDAALKNRSVWMSNLYVRILLEKAYLLAWAQHNPESARSWLAQVKRNGRNNSVLFYRAEAAVQLAEGNLPKAIEAVKKGLDALKMLNSTTGMTILEAEWLQEILEIAQKDEVSN